MGLNSDMPIDVDLISPNPSPMQGTGARASFGNPSRGEEHDTATPAQTLPTNDSRTDSPMSETVRLPDFVLEHWS